MSRGGRKPGVVNKDRGYKPPRAVARNPGVVRCLGPCREHTFWSPDKARVRVCERGREKIAGISPLLRNPASDQSR
jgi:hypothetical protein